MSQEQHLKYYSFDYPDYPTIVIINAEEENYDNVMAIGMHTSGLLPEQDSDVIPVELTKDEALLVFLKAAEKSGSGNMKLADVFQLFNSVKNKTVFTFKQDAGVIRYQYM
jgi:hypothetical protein